MDSRTVVSAAALRPARARGAVPKGLRRLRSYGARDAPNLLVHGDHERVLPLLAAGSLARSCALAYLDPPYNTGRRFAEYVDRASEGAWSDALAACLEGLRPLMRADGTVVVEIDDCSLGAALTVGDAVLGAKNRISVVTLVRSAATGHKAQNRGPVNVTDYVLIYARDRRAWRYFAERKPRAGSDPAYRTYVENIDDPPELWRFAPLARTVAASLGFADTRTARRELGPERMARELERFALEHARSVVRFAQPRIEAIAKEARELVEASREDRERVFVLPRAGRPPFILRGGNRVLRLSDKVTRFDDTPTLVEPLTNVWDDIPFQGIAREGGVRFSRNKKPERLLARLLALTTEAGDWVIDPYLGSGTTAAVAQKMGRRWIGIERGEHAVELAEPRLARVVAGDDATGISRTARAEDARREATDPALRGFHVVA